MGWGRRRFLGTLTACGLTGQWFGTLSGGQSLGTGPLRQGELAEYEWTSLPEGAVGPVRTFEIANDESVPDPAYSGNFGLLILNDGAPRSVELVIAGEELGRVVDTTIELPADGYLDVDFEQADRYVVAVRLPNTIGARYWFPIGRWWFDCNESGISATVRPTGRVVYSGTSTLRECPSVAEGHYSGSRSVDANGS